MRCFKCGGDLGYGDFYGTMCYRCKKEVSQNDKEK